MINNTNSLSFDFLPETFKTVQERVEKQNAQDQTNGFVPESEYGFNSQGESIHIDEFGAYYFKSYTDEETGKTAIVSHRYQDSDSDGTYDEYGFSISYGTADMIEKLSKEGKIFNPDGMYFYDTDNNGEFDTLSVKADEHGFEWHTYSRESEESNTFIRGFGEKIKDFFKNLF